jgi:hypothetical protein
MTDKLNVFDAAKDAAAALAPLDEPDRKVALQLVAVSLGLAVPRASGGGGADDELDGDDTDDEEKPKRRSGTPSAQEFLEEKKPTSVLEEIACLAFYLAKFDETRRWKPAQIEKLGHNAGGSGFVKVSRDVSNAKAGGVVTSVGGGLWQITRDGEALVKALPDRSTAEAVLKARRSAKRGTKKAAKKKATTK